MPQPSFSSALVRKGFVTGAHPGDATAVSAVERDGEVVLPHRRRPRALAVEQRREVVDARAEGQVCGTTRSLAMR